MILVCGIRGEQWPASLESSFYTGNNLPDSLSMNEWPSALRPRKARDLNNKSTGGHPLLYYCKFIAAFLCDPFPSRLSKCPVDWEASKQRKHFRTGARTIERYMEKIKQILFLCSTVQMHLESTASYFCVTELNTELPFEGVAHLNEEKSKLWKIFLRNNMYYDTLLHIFLRTSIKWRPNMLGF